jgi:TadE-like protein
MTRISRCFSRAWREEAGVATVEFVMAVPVLIAIFVASFESGLFMVRAIMLEQSLDMVMRELRLGHYVDENNETSDLVLKEEICKRSIILGDCVDSLKINLSLVDMDNFDMPTTATACVDRTLPIEVPLVLKVGQGNDLMLIRACMVQDAIWPLSGVGLGLSRTVSGGGYEIIAASAFAVEPS